MINGAGGGSGSFAIRLAMRAGAHVAGVDNAAKLDFMRSLGADEVIDYHREDFTRSAVGTTSFSTSSLAGRCSPVSRQVTIQIDRTLGLDEVPDALRYVGEGCALGNVVIEIH